MSFKVISPDNAPNFCYEKIDAETGESIDFIQSDWDYTPLASSMGWVPCKCGHTDGTIDCQHRTVHEMISEARDYIESHLDEVFPVGE